MNIFKKFCHDRLIAQLKKTVDEKRISVEKKTVNLGLEFIGTMFFTDKDKLVCHWLIKYFGYKFYVERFAFRITPSTVHDWDYITPPTANEAPSLASPQSRTT